MCLCVCVCVSVCVCLCVQACACVSEGGLVIEATDVEGVREGRTSWASSSPPSTIILTDLD